MTGKIVIICLQFVNNQAKAAAAIFYYGKQGDFMQILSALVCFHCLKTHSNMHVQVMAKLDINRGGRNMRPTSLCSHHKAIQTCLTTLKCFTNFHGAKESTETQLGSYLTVAAALYLFVLQLHPR